MINEASENSQSGQVLTAKSKTQNTVNVSPCFLLLSRLLE
jgi:hypothetical protein